MARGLRTGRCPHNTNRVQKGVGLLFLGVVIGLVLCVGPTFAAQAPGRTTAGADLGQTPSAAASPLSGQEAGVQQVAAEALIVSPDGPIASIQAAVMSARPHQRIEVHKGTYSGAITIDRPLTLVGIDRPVIDGEGEGSVVSVNAPDVTIKGFDIQHSGDNPMAEDSGILGKNANRIHIQDNRLTDVLYGINLKNAPQAVVHGNTIKGKPHDMARRGDGMRIWYSAKSLIEENEVLQSRDVVFWFSEGTTIRRNHISGGRYGIHFMYNNNNVIAGNLLEDNSVGAFVMYSVGLHLEGNTFAHNRGSSGYGLGLKDMDEVTAENNFFVGNRVGLYLDNSPRAGYPEANTYHHNVFAYNDIGLSAQPSVSNNTISQNSFVDNFEQVSARTGGTLKANRWSMEGTGNYWSDYLGYDKASDGIGDQAYAPKRAFEHLADRYPVLRFFLMSPVQQAINLTAKAFPLLQPEPKLVDPNPLMRPVIPASHTVGKEEQSGTSPVLILFAGCLVAAGLFARLGAVARSGKGGERRKAPTHESQLKRTKPSQGASLVNLKREASSSSSRPLESRVPSRRPDLPVRVGTTPAPSAPAQRQPGRSSEKSVVKIENLVKRYGKAVVVDGVSLDIHANQAVALWGPNGAGKTTIIKCLLGLVSFNGNIAVDGYSVKSQGKQSRNRIGYVPQNLALYPYLNVDQTLTMWANLRGTGPEAIERSLERVQLKEERRKAVGALSGGQRQRLALAIALLSDPALLILDEATANLDVEARESFLSLLATLKADGKSLLFTAHRLDEIEQLADRVIVLRDGTIRSDCAPLELPGILNSTPYLRLNLSEADVELALSILQQGGYKPRRAGNASLVVRADADRKAEPLGLLLNTGIPVENFDLWTAVPQPAERPVHYEASREENVQ